MNRIHRFLPVLVCLMLVFGMLAAGGQPVRADAATLYVDDDNVCGGNSPCYSHPQDAVNAANPGDTILVYPGTYDSRYSICPWAPNCTPQDLWAPAVIVYKDGLTLRSVEGPANTIIQSTHVVWSNAEPVARSTNNGVTGVAGWAPHALVIVANNVTVDGFTFHRPNGCTASPGDCYNNTAGVFIGSKGAGYSDFLGHANNALVQNNIFSDVWMSVSIWHSSGNTITHNTVQNLTNGKWEGMTCYDGNNPTETALLPQSTNNTISFNTLTNKGIYVGAWGGPTSSTGSRVIGNTTVGVRVFYTTGPVTVAGNSGTFAEMNSSQIMNLTGLTSTAPASVDAASITFDAVAQYSGSSDGSGLPINFLVNGVSQGAQTTAVGGHATFTYTPPALGTYTLRVEVADYPQYFAETITTIDHLPAAQNQSVITDQDTPASITLVATDADNDPLTYAIVTGPAHGALTGTPPAVTYTPNTGYTGGDSFTFKANDGIADGNTATVTISVQGEIPPIPSSYYGQIHIYDTPPVAGSLIQSFKPGDNGPLAEAEIQTSGSNLIYTLIVPGGSKGAASENDPVTILFGDRVLGIAPWHAGGNLELNLHPPQAVPGGPYTGHNYAPVSFNATANDWGGDVSLYEWDWDNDGVFDATGAAQSHIWNTVGSYTGALRVKDVQGGVGMATFTVAISNIDPVLDPINNQTVDELTLLSFTASATDTDALTYSLVDAPLGAAINPSSGAFTWTPTEAQGSGSYPFTVKVCDTLAVCDEEAITVTVNEVNLAPVLAHINDQTVEEMALLTFTAVGTDPDLPANTLVYSLLGSPSGASINSSTGVFTWTPTYDQGPAVYPFTVQVCDTASTPLCASQAVTVTVTPITRTHSISLLPGWNLVSFNLHPTSTAVGDVLTSVAGNFDLVYAWDASGGHSSSGNWLKYDNIPASIDNLSTLDETKGFWIHMTTADTLEVTGTVNPLTQIAYYDNASGWNLVAYPSAVNGAVPAIFDSHGASAAYFIYEYNPANIADPWKLYDRYAAPFANDLTHLSPGMAYWVRATGDGTWDVMY